MEGGESSADLVINKRFVSEAELEDRRKRRQEEWEKVRKPEDPKECPEEAYDPRSLYERLQEQKDKKQQEFEEQFKFKNMVRGLDEDESKFLDEVSRQQALVEKQRHEEDLKELNEYRISLSKVGVSADLKKEADKKLPVKSENRSKFSQAKLLAGAVKHRSSEGANSVKRLKLDPDPDHDKVPEKPSCVPLGSSSTGGSAIHCPSAAVCIGILPGLGAYSGSSDSESSSDSEGTINSTGKIVSSVFRGSNFFDAPL
ncbi:PSME3-interacting protein [Candoia aspera]|uniref:PSME3-interacting protein n=1 Tax=Candoia aspera TaxID=51853 RepID=UPI002FD7C644